MTMIFGHKIPQKLFCKNTSEDKETQKLEMGGCRRDSLPCASRLKPIFSPDFTLPVLHREETFTFSYHFQNRAQLTPWFILNFDNPESQIFSLIPTADLSTSYLWSQTLWDGNSSIKDKIINAVIFFHLGNISILGNFSNLATMGGTVSTMLGGNKDKAIEMKTIAPWKR